VSAVKQADVRFYLDADILGLARILARLRPDVTYPGDPGAIVHKRQRPPCIITSPASKDPHWIPEVTRRGWLIVTRDSRIQSHHMEIAAVRESSARMVALTGREAHSVFDQLEVLMCRWRDIQRRVDEPGPFIYAATRTSFTSIPLN
jgi:hypothetical protein